MVMIAIARAKFTQGREAASRKLVTIALVPLANEAIPVARGRMETISTAMDFGIAMHMKKTRWASKIDVATDMTILVTRSRLHTAPTYTTRAALAKPIKILTMMKMGEAPSR